MRMRLNARLCAFAVILIAAVTGRAQGASAFAMPTTSSAHHRDEALTYLGFPVWSPTSAALEYADYIGVDGRPSTFPYWRQLGQMWGGYGHALKATIRLQAEPRVHAHILTDNSLNTLTCAIRSAYEITLGRMAELTRTAGPTDEERYAANVAQDYANFIRTHPWYAFDYGVRLKKLWQETGFGGPDLVRKWERKYALSSEYASKAAVGWLVGRFASLDTAATPSTTAVIVDRWVDRIAGNWPEMQRVRSFPGGGELVLLPRHEAFQTVALAIARSGANFTELAGNGGDARVLVSVIVPRAWRPDSEGSVSLFEQDMLTYPEQKRVALTVPVRELAQTLRELDGMQITIERVYDY